MFSKKTQKSSTSIPTSIISKSIPIQYTNNNKQCTLQQNLCDPFTKSPPNEFMQKLYTRMEYYNSTSLGVHSKSLNNE